MNFVICGLPRSGTTIIARFIGGLPGVAVVHEPLQCFARYGSYPPWPSDCAHIGIKEPFHVNNAIAAQPNMSHLAFLKYAGWKFIYVSREQVPHFESLQRWGVDEEVFMATLLAFDKFRNYEPTLNYDSFCADPIGTWNRHNPIGVLATEVRLAPCSKPFMGDWKAKDATEIFKP